MTRTGTFQYVPFESLDDFLRRGWMIVAPLGAYSVLMWRCECGDQTCGDQT